MADSAEPPRSVEEVKAMLETTEKGGFRNSMSNCLTVFQCDPLLSGAVAYNLLTDRTDILNYDKRVSVEGGAFLAWGHLTYTKPLTEKQAADYELRPAPEVSGLLREGRPRPIAEQMKEAARLAGERQAPSAPKRNAPDRGDR